MGGGSSARTVSGLCGVLLFCVLFFLIVHYASVEEPPCNYRPLPPPDTEDLAYRIVYDSVVNPEHGQGYLGDYPILPLAATVSEILPRNLTTIATSGGQGFNFALVDGMTSHMGQPDPKKSRSEYFQQNHFAESLAKELQGRVNRERAVDPFALLCASYNQVKSQPGHAMVGVVGISGTYLKSVSVGSVVVMVIREGVIVWESLEEIDTNPFRPPYLSSSQGMHLVRVTETKIQPEDAVVIASNGLLENISRPLLAQIVWSGLDAALVSRSAVIGPMVSQLSLGISPTPFSIAANIAGFDWIGGRPDDLTLLVVGATEKS